MADGPDQDDLAAAWGAALGDEEAGSTDDAMAAEWAAMLDGPAEEAEEDPRGAERVLNQSEIDNLLGFNAEELDGDDRKGIRAIINSAMVSSSPSRTWPKFTPLKASAPVMSRASLFRAALSTRASRSPFPKEGLAVLT